MENVKRKKWSLVCVLTLLALFFVDQATKAAAQIFLAGPPVKDINIIPGWVALTYVENDAIAFGIGSGNHAFMTVIMVLSPVLAVCFIALALTVFKNNRSAQMCLFIIASGAIGNFVDRLFIFNEAGAAVVRDFVYLRFFNVCNIADFCVTLGTVAFVFLILFIGPHAVIPLKKSWREQAKREEKEKEDEKA